MSKIDIDLSSMPDNPLFSTVQQPGVGNILTPGIPLDFSAFPRNEPVPAPRLGEHTEQVLSEVLGVSAGEYGKLHDRELVAGSAGIIRPVVILRFERPCRSSSVT